MLYTPFYDPTKTYEENYDKGPYGVFSDKNVYKQIGGPKYDFLDRKVYLPFGIPSGPVLNSKYAKAAFDKGFDIVVYKTVRSCIFPCHPFPNVLSITVNGGLTLKKTKNKIVADSNYHEPLSITNSFGVPSKSPSEWQKDVKKAISYEGKGQVLVLSFMGTVKPSQTQQGLIDDFVLAAQLSLQTGAKILEINLSCPNIGNEGLVCYNLNMTKKVLEAIRNNIGNTPLIVKVGYFENKNDLEKLAKIINEYADAISAINTIVAEIVDKNGNQALPGKMRNKSGICGHAIKWAGLDMVERLQKIREKNNYKLKIIGVGGVTKSKDYFEYINAGADAVMSATGAMWNPYLAMEIKKKFLYL